MFLIRMKLKKRLDTLLVEKGLALSIEEAQALVMTGKVYGDNQQPLTKPGLLLEESASFFLKDSKSLYVSRAGEKLKCALDGFSISVADKVFLDIGSSTGGFSDCLLQHGAKHVFAVDVGYGIIHEKLRKNPRISLLERTNARLLKREELLGLSPLAARIDAVVMDVSFISIQKIIEPLSQSFPEVNEWIFLFKPQFEVEKKDILTGGIVRNQEVVETAKTQFETWMRNFSFQLVSPAIESSLSGKKSGNIESLYYFRKNL